MTNFERLAYSMNGLGDFDPNLVTDYTNATANLISAIKGSGSSSSSSNNSNTTPQVIYVPQQTQPAQDNTMLYVALGGLALIAMMFMMNQKK
jgi:hypothetical protein